uniref:Uncharacterized protein n=1 Tax=Populus trichocarpa TaxID=3694 RepID=A0A3N7HJF4_POPTR
MTTRCNSISMIRQLQVTCRYCREFAHTNLPPSDKQFPHQCYVHVINLAQ